MTDTKDQAKDHSNNHEKDHSGKQGFASMPHEKVQEIARKGGQTSHGSHAKDSDTEDDINDNTAESDDEAEE